MPDADDGLGHFIPHDVNKMEEISSMIKPAGCEWSDLKRHRQEIVAYGHCPENLH